MLSLFLALSLTLVVEMSFFLILRKKDCFRFLLFVLLNVLTNLTMNLLYVFVFSYSGFIKDLLLQYKERLDIALAPIFLSFVRPLLKTLFRKHVFVPVPSTREKEEMRGFSHLEEMLKAWNIPFVNFLEKRGGVQKENAFLERYSSKMINKSAKAVSLEKKRIVLFDDVLTSGETFRQSLAILKGEKTKGIWGLVLMDNHFDRDLRLKS